MNEVRACLTNGGSDSYHHDSGVCLTLIVVRIALNCWTSIIRVSLTNVKGTRSYVEGLFKVATCIFYLLKVSYVMRAIQV